MTAKAVRGSFKEADTRVSPTLEVLIVYEDLGTALRAKHLLDQLSCQLGQSPAPNAKLWKSNLLQEPLLREQAAVEAAAADVIILSIHGQTELSTAVKEWLHRWLVQKEPRPYALGLLLDSRVAGRDRNSPVAAEVQTAAGAAGIDLFFGYCEAPASELEAAIAAIGQRTHRSFSVLEEMLKRPPRHRWWGINE